MAGAPVACGAQTRNSIGTYHEEHLRVRARFPHFRARRVQRWRQRRRLLIPRTTAAAEDAAEDASRRRRHRGRRCRRGRRHHDGGRHHGGGGCRHRGDRAGDSRDDPAAGSGTTPTPTPAAENSFTTELVACSLGRGGRRVLRRRPLLLCRRYGHDDRDHSNAIPNHDAGIFPNIGNPEVTPQTLSWSIPLTPTFVGTPTTVRIPAWG